MHLCFARMSKRFIFILGCIMIGLYPAERSFSAFKTTIQQWNPYSDFPSDAFLLNRSSPTDKAWLEYYIPFDYVEEKAKIIILGITPGTTQWANAVKSAGENLRKGWSDEAVLKEAKKFGAFSGPMRERLVRMLDLVGVNKIIGTSSCSKIYEPDNHDAHMTSCFVNPIFNINRKGYNEGSMKPRVSLFTDAFKNGFLKEVQALPNAYIVALGSASDILSYAVQQGWIEEERIISGIQHPSLANPRTSYFLGDSILEKKGSNDPAKVDEGKQSAINKVNAILQSM